MKKRNTLPEWQALSPSIKFVWAKWAAKKGHIRTKEEVKDNCLYLCKCDLEELAFSLGIDLQHDTSPEFSTRNNLLDYNEYQLGWDGVEPFDAIWYTLHEKLKRRINQYLIVNNK